MASRALLPSDTSLPRLLRERGYATGLFGKWHLGVKPEFSPNRHGFDEFWGFLGGSHDYYDPADLYHNDQPSTMTGYLTDEITAHATTFIAAHQREPFFVEVAYNAAHWPFQPPNLAPGQRARPDMLHDGTRADYVAILERADKGVGDILTLLDRLQLTRNTLVVFTSDNGGEWLSHNAPLFHRKSTLWEGGIRVPALMRWPDQLPAGVVSKQVGITMDLTASFLDAAGIVPPSSYSPDGISLLPMLKEQRTVERTLYWRIKTAGRDQKAVRRGRWKYMRDGVGTVDSVHELLFDLDRTWASATTRPTITFPCSLNFAGCSRPGKPVSMPVSPSRRCGRLCRGRNTQIGGSGGIRVSARSHPLRRVLHHRGHQPLPASGNDVGVRGIEGRPGAEDRA